MKILHIYKTFVNDTVGGVEQVIANLVQPSGNASFNHSVLSLSKKCSDIDSSYAGIANIRYKEQYSIASNAISWSLMRDFKKITADYDVLHYHFPWPFADLMHLMWRIKKPSIVTYHADIVRQKKLLYVYKPMMHRFLSQVDALVATSPNYLKTSPILQSYQDKTRVIPIGISQSNYPSSEAREAFWHHRFGHRFFLFIGVMRYYKGLHILLDAMQDTGYPLVIVGEGPVEEELKRQAKALRLTNVHFLGKLPDEDKNALLRLCLSVVFPSHLRSEAFGVSLLEGAMFGKALISTDIGTGTTYINQHKTTGLVVPPNDALALRQAMDYIWTHPKESALMGEAATARYQALFTREKMVSGYEALYSQLGNLF